MTTRFLKLITIAGLLLVSFSLTARVYAEGSENKTVAIYGSIGFSDPNGYLAAGADLGYYGLTRLSLAMSQRVEASFGLDYHSIPLDPAENINFEGKKFTAILFNAGLKVNPGELDAEVLPFLILAGGIALVDFSDTLFGFSGPAGNIFADSDIRPYMEIGGGFEFGMLQVWVKFSNIFLQVSDASFISFGIGGKLYLI